MTPRVLLLPVPPRGGAAFGTGLLQHRLAGRELPGFSVFQLGTAPHHHRSFGACLPALAFCLPQRRVQGVGFHLQNSARAVPSTAVSYVAASRSLLCISKCQWRALAPQETHSAQPGSTSFLVFSLRLSLSSTSSHNSDFRTNSRASYHLRVTPPQCVHVLTSRQPSLAQLYCLVPTLPNDMAHQNKGKYFT